MLQVAVWLGIFAFFALVMGLLTDMQFFLFFWGLFLVCDILAALILSVLGQIHRAWWLG